ncbi:16979_t:CDS:2 [Cetraspora pellucida]|uniref:16979_t:CDS:1 n=1 Tax=Cetraspora pellucida TaxID=1433469 RepID=A0A9N9NHX0_9GLOM|nr:16979_t:CDS:2 [Cetraspora pellucida]
MSTPSIFSYEEDYESIHREEYEPMYEKEHEPIYEEDHEPIYKKEYEPELQLDESEVSESSQKLAYQHGTTSNLKRHLNSHKTKVPELKKLNIKEGISVIIKKNRPFQIIEDTELRSIFTYLKPDAIAPSADLIKQHIVSDFEKEYMRLCEKLQKIPSGVALTTDIWTTDTNDKFFMAVTIYYINDSWKLKHILLDFIHISGPYTGIIISDAMHECFTTMGIITKLVAITRDNASSNNKFLEEFSNSLSQSGFQFDTIVLQMALDSMALMKVDLQQYILNDNDWKKIKLFIKVLQLFKETTVIMSSSNYPTLLMSVSLYHILLKMLKETQQMNNILQCLMQGCEAATSKLLNYCYKTNIFHLAAIVLDLRLKFNYFEELECQDIEDLIAEPFATNIMSQIYKRAHIEWQSELDIYFMMPHADPQIDILKWW